MRRGEPIFGAFDILWLDGEALCDRPLIERKRILRGVLRDGADRLLYVQHRAGRGVDLFEMVCGLDLEGIVAKRRDGLYTPDQTTRVKIKNRAYSKAEGRGEQFRGRAAGVS